MSRDGRLPNEKPYGYRLFYRQSCIMLRRHASSWSLSVCHEKRDTGTGNSHLTTSFTRKVTGKFDEGVSVLSYHYRPVPSRLGMVIASFRLNDAWPVANGNRRPHNYEAVCTSSAVKRQPLSSSRKHIFPVIAYGKLTGFCFASTSIMNIGTSEKNDNSSWFIVASSPMLIYSLFRSKCSQLLR